MTYLVLLLLLAFALSASTQESISPQLEVSFDPPTPAAQVLFPEQVRAFGPTIQQRYRIFLTISTYEISAACHPVALSFFGVKDHPAAKLCIGDSPLIIQSYIAHRLYASEFPKQAKAYADYLTSLGLTPNDGSSDQGTENGFANFVADRAVSYFSNDGWNSQGDLTRTFFRQRFADTTGYIPQNLAQQAAQNVSKPLRWQPLTEERDMSGLFRSQVHLTPHIGTTTPFALSREEFERRRTESPYRSPDREGSISEEDEKIINEDIDMLFNLSANLTPKRRFLARWWNDKSISLASFLPFYLKSISIPQMDAASLSLAQAIAQWDSILVVWKEKVRHDLVRPISAVRRLRSGQKFALFVDEERGVVMVDGAEWMPLIATQPHAEYPSASSILCTASLEAVQIGLEKYVGAGGIVPFTATFAPNAFSFPISQSIRVRFNSPEEASRSCGRSRLLGGVHFRPAVAASRELGRGIGKIAVEHVLELVEGRVPDSCARCRR